MKILIINIRNQRSIKSILILFLLFTGDVLLAQDDYTKGQDIIKSIDEREQRREASIFRNYPVRNVGPVVQGGRISDIAVNPENTKEFFVAFASGGVFRTLNNGITFSPVFDNVGALTIGDICISSSNPEIIWVGTGENNSSRSSYAGSGVYRSIDGGQSWQFMGLESTQHTGRIIIHPVNPDIVWVAAMGNLYTHNPERGVYKSTDGGETWTKTLFINDSTGIIDLLIHPENPDVLWAAAWERTRKAWNFKGHGPGSGIYKSIDGGNTWKEVMSGIENQDMAGRIGLDICRNQPNVLYALVDSQVEEKKEKERKDDELITSDFLSMSKEELLALDNERLNDFLKGNNFPEKYDAETIKKEIAEEKYDPADLAEYLGDANNALFDTEIQGAEIYRSDDAGESWEKTHEYRLEGVYYTYGYYFGEIRVSPVDPSKIYVFGVPLLKSVDGGKTFVRTDTIGDVHADHQAMWIDPEDPEHILLGNDGGLYMTYDEGAAWEHINNVPAGQFYTVNVDMEDPYNIYGGLQDNGILFGSSKSVPNETQHWKYLFGGDGMFVIPDPRNYRNVYLGYQFGNYYRINTETRERTYITPQNDIGEPSLRFNWRTPLLMSSFNPDILYIGAQKIYRTFDRGESWEALSEDLTKNLPNGNVPYSTITCIEESPLTFGLLYVGTDDGNFQVSKDAGYSWDLRNTGLPEKKWVTSIQPSVFNESKVYLSLTGYRDDDFNTYVYKSLDYGKNWMPIKGHLQNEPVNMILEDPVKEGLLYLGTDHGTYFSFDEGEKWHILSPVPNVANYDMVIHPRDNELVIGTHGRSIYVLPLDPVRELAEKGVNESFIVTGPETIRYSENWGDKRYPYLSPEIPKAHYLYYVPEKTKSIKFEVFEEGNKLFETDIRPEISGFNTFKWNLIIDHKKDSENSPQFIRKGNYQLRFSYNKHVEELPFEVK